MPNILLELLCEEIPARMQVAAMEHLKKAITNGLVDAGLTYESPALAFVTPRRLTLHVVNVPIATKPQTIERKGPRVGAPEGAIQGFLKASGLGKIEDAELQDDGKGGQFYIAKQHKEGRPTAEVLQELVRKTVQEFPWPKSMRWGSGTLNWVRPLHNICCTLSSETDVEVIDCSIEHVTGKAETRGHTFLAPAPFAVKRFEDYVEGLEARKVVLCRERRKQIILNDARTMAFAQGLELVEDQGLLEEIAGLVEWPVVLMGSFDEAFLNIPERVIQTTIRVNQKCFVLKRLPPCGGAAEGTEAEGGIVQKFENSPPSVTLRVPAPPQGGSQSELSNHFLLVSNLQATDGGAAIIAGNERVIRARLSDAKFFWENDQKIKLEDRVEGLKNVVFHEKLGTQWDRVKRIEGIAIDFAVKSINKYSRGEAEIAGFEQRLLELESNVKQAANLAKADLLTEMVGEFPELQGYMGRKYAEMENLNPDVCAALEDHYKPRGPSDEVPNNPVSIAVAFAEKIDILAGFWSIDEKPTGSKDPYALRRAALGVIRILEARKIYYSLPSLLKSAASEHKDFNENRQNDLFKFFGDRVKVQLIEEGYRHDYVAAVMANWVEFDGNSLLTKSLLDVIGRLMPTDTGTALMVGFTRANNILKVEEKKSTNDAFEAMPTGLDEGENNLKLQMDNLSNTLNKVVRENPEIPLMQLSTLSTAIHTYIENTMINDPDQQIRVNRLRLLAYYRRLTRTVADFEKMEGV